MAAASGPKLIDSSNIACVVDPAGISASIDRNLLRQNFSQWTVSTGSSSGYGQNGDGNSRILDTDPWGGTSVVWDVSGQDATSDADGGWNSSWFPVDSSKMYRFSVWIRRKTIGNGSTYMGMYAGNSGQSNLATPAAATGASATTNFYFWSGGWGFPANEWVLVVGHIYPEGTAATGANHPDSGRYQADGTKSAISKDGIWPTGTVYARHRTYLYYSTDTSTNQQFYDPRVEVVDGTETPITDLLKGGFNLDVSRNVAVGVGKSTFSSSGLSFNGSTDYVVFNNPVTVTSPYTVVMWCKPNALLATGTSSAVRKTPLVGPGPVWNPGIWLTQDFLRVHADTEYRDISISWADTNYRMIGMVFDGTTVQTIFNDQLSTGTRTAYAPANPTTLHLGSENTTGNAYNWNGNIDNVQFYDRAITADEVKQLFNAHRGRFGI